MLDLHFPIQHELYSRMNTETSGMSVTERVTAIDAMLEKSHVDLKRALFEHAPETYTSILEKIWNCAIEKYPTHRNLGALEEEFNRLHKFAAELVSM